MLALDRVINSDLHTLADFAELLCLQRPDRVLSIDDLDDHLFDVCGEQRGRRPLPDVFAHLIWRTRSFGDWYPFTVAQNQQSVAAPDGLSSMQELYVFLLLCANLPYLPQPYTPLTDAFERLAHLALRRVLPDGSDVRTFGKNTTNYTGTKTQRLHQLARELGGRPAVHPSMFRRGDSGDGGIDLAGWLELDDDEPENKPSCLAQCACSREEWSRKQYEISNGKLRKLFNQTSPWLELLCMPICYRDNNGRWAYDAEVGETILLDRPRLLRFIDAEADGGTIAPPPLVNLFLDSRYELS